MFSYRRHFDTAGILGDGGVMWHIVNFHSIEVPKGSW